MAIAVISGNGANRKTNFANIHYGGRSISEGYKHNALSSSARSTSLKFGRV